MFYPRVILVLTLIFSSIGVAAQKILLLEKSQGTKRLRFYEGDYFAFRIDGDKYSVKGNIDLILDYGIVHDGELYRFENISMVVNFKKFAVFRALSKSALSAVPSMLITTALHRGLNTGDQPIIDKNALQVSGVMSGIGLIMWPFKARKYNLKNKWRLRTIDVTPG